MSDLYSIRSVSGGYIIAKFDDDFNIDATYNLTDTDDTNHPVHCDCPSWPRKHSCKHTQMLDKFLQRGKIDTDWMYDPKTSSWHQPLADKPSVTLDDELEAHDQSETPAVQPQPSSVARRF